MRVRWVRDDEMADGATVGVGTDREYGTPVVWHPYYSLDHLPRDGARPWLVWCFCEPVRPGRHPVALADEISVETSETTTAVTWSLWAIAACQMIGERRGRLQPRQRQSTLDVVVVMICHAWPGRPIEEDALAATELMNGLGVANPLDLFLVYHDALDQHRKA